MLVTRQRHAELLAAETSHYSMEKRYLPAAAA